jgi:tetratricopeptide (TPR) repeat protein/DNA-binding winged helix-turn-helix (wHTH) protein
LSGQQKHVYAFGPFRIDGVKRLLLRDCKTIPLTPKAFDTLLVLVVNHERVLEKDELMDLLWPDSHVEEANLALNISVLRKALNERPREHRYIVTIPGRGYRFVAPVKELGPDEIALGAGENVSGPMATDTKEPSQSQAISPGTQAPASAPRSRANRRMLLAALTVTSVAALTVILIRERSSAPRVSPSVESIAVLPFRCLGMQDGDEYLGFGIADAIITRLGNARRTTVRPSSAVIKYAGLELDPAATGRELGVSAVLEGSIRRSGERVRVTVQLVSSADAQPLWGDTFDEYYTHIFAIEDSISAQVTHALQLRLTSDEQQRLNKRYTENHEAYEAYLRGRYFQEKVTEEGFRKSVLCFQEAIEKEPDYAPAYAGMASCYCLLSGLGLEVMAPRLLMPEAKSAALKALELDDKLAEAHAAHGMIQLKYDWDWSAAEKAFKEAIALNPSYSQAHLWYSLFLEAMARPEEAIAAAQRARELDPLSLRTNVNVAAQLHTARRYDEAIEHIERALDLDSDFWAAHWRLGDCYAQKRMFKEAIAALQKAVSLSNGNPAAMVSLGYTYAISGQRGKAMKVITELDTMAERRYISPANVAAIYAGLGDTDRALEWLERAYEMRSRTMVWLNVWPQYDALRSDPRFTDLLRRVGLPR